MRRRSPNGCRADGWRPSSCGGCPTRRCANCAQSGLLRLNQPARFGGPELGVEAILDVGAILAGGDVSVGWAYVILASHEWIIGLFPDQAQHDIWDDDPTVLMSSSFAPSRATVRRVDGGWELADGVWPFSSGSDHAQWAMVGFRTPATDDGVPPPVRWGLVPRSDYTVGSDWRTVGAQGTGSNSLSIAHTVVPDHRILDPMLALMGMSPGAEVNTSALFRLPFTCLAVYLAAPILGGARAAVQHFTDYMQSKRLIYTGERVGTEGAMLVHLGEVAAMTSAAEAVLRAAARQIDDPAAGPPDPAAALAVGRDCDVRREAVRRRRRRDDAAQRRFGAVRGAPGQQVLARRARTVRAPGLQHRHRVRQLGPPRDGPAADGRAVRLTASTTDHHRIDNRHTEY